MWCSMIWMTYLGCKSPLGTNQANMLANKRNCVTETVGTSFLVVREDVVRPRGLTTEGVEHIFALIRSEKKEATVMEMMEIDGKQRRKMDTVHTSNLAMARSSNSGYGYRASLSSFVDSSKNIPPECEHMGAQKSGFKPLVF